MRWYKIILFIGVLLSLAYTASMYFVEDSKEMIVEKEINYPVETLYPQFVNLQKFSNWNDYFSKEKVEKVIIGEPKQMNGLPSESAEIIEKFIKTFKITFPEMPLDRVDERFTSKMAFQTMIDSGLKKKQRQNKALIDEIAATIMLQDYMNRK